MVNDPFDDSEWVKPCSVRSTSTPTPVRAGRTKVRKIKKVVEENRIDQEFKKNEEYKLRIKAKIEEQKNALSEQRKLSNAPEIMAALSEDIADMELETEKLLENLERRESGGKHGKFARDFSMAPEAIMFNLSEDIEGMEFEAKKLFEELERAKREEEKEQLAIIADNELLAGRVYELEDENRILETRLQSGQATVDSIRADIASMASSNQDCKKATREAKNSLQTLQTEQENLRTKLQQAENDLQAKEAEAKGKTAARNVEIDQKEIFEQGTREILDLQRNHRLKKQISHRKMQQREQKRKQKMQQHVQEQLKQPIKEKEPLRRNIDRQNSWWDLDTKTQTPKQDIRPKSFHVPVTSPVTSESLDRTIESLAQTISEDSTIDDSFRYL